MKLAIFREYSWKTVKAFGYCPWKFTKK